MSPPDWLAQMRARCAAASAGPWVVWDGPAYEGGGRDLCIGGPGETWLANMDHRRCVREREHYDHYIAQSCAREPISDVCRIDTEITAEQEANAQLIAHARADVPGLLDLVTALAGALDTYGEHDATCPYLAWENLRADRKADHMPPPTCNCGLAEALARYREGPGATTGGGDG